jgi:mono/diheme cytochrome c family protein
MPPKRLVLSLGLCLVSGTPNWAQAADAAQGQGIAERWCAACHVVSRAQTRGFAAVPSFHEIARRYQLSGTRLSLFLADPHPKMPDMQLSQSEIADLVAYIRSQR